MNNRNTVLSRFAKTIAIRSAKADSRVEVFFQALKNNTEAHITISLKPCESGKYAVIRNGQIAIVKHADITASDLLAVKVQVEMFALTNKTIHRFDAGKEYVKVSSSFEVGINLDSDELHITALTRDDEKQLQLSDMLRFKGKQFAHITESDLMRFATLNIGKFVNKIVNNTPSEPRKREYANREQTDLTIYGMYKAQQTAKRQAKLDATKPADSVVTTETLSA